MPTIEVTKGEDLKVRFAHGEQRTVLRPGEHELTDEQFDHWYIQGHLDSGRVRLLPEASASIETEDIEPVTDTPATEAAAGTGEAAEPATETNETAEPATEAAAEDAEVKLLAVFPKLVEGDYKADGVPTVKAVGALLGEDVKAEQIAAAWTKYQAGQE
ncbi:hypothetical protein [Pseudodesulfovibrio sp.]|uniref:hypothetical protein n=1 Tax=Pseudodesulfovibrio sp. TaxID=2035812 RepID=UPI0026159EA8|nr:hypothetical protein [Pseudodesulfovibrio sp.]MDD3310958.1 hypothetical protein [Pseudodesulfovibrio sp.]